MEEDAKAAVDNMDGEISFTLGLQNHILVFRSQCEMTSPPPPPLAFSPFKIWLSLPPPRKRLSMMSGWGRGGAVWKSVAGERREAHEA